MPIPNPDQSDVIAANEVLTAERDVAIRERDEARASFATLTAERDGLNARLTTACNELAARTGTVATLTTERDALAAADHDFNRRLATELAKQGIRPTAVPTPSKSDAGASDLLAQYQALTDPTQKAQFLTKHAGALKTMLVGA